MRLIALICLVAALVPRPATAQPAPWAPERLTPGWVFTPSMVFGVLHDSNVTVRAVNEPITSEVVGLLNPRGEIDFNGRHTHLNIGYSGTLEAYRELSELNRYEQKGRFELRHQTGPRLNLRSQASYSRVPTTDRLELGAGVLPFIGIGSDHADASGGFTLKTSSRTSVDGGISLQWIRFDRDTSDDPDQFLRFLQNGRSIAPFAGAMYSVSERVSVGGNWNYRHVFVGDLDTLKVHTATGDLAWQAGERTAVRGGLGASYLTSDATPLAVLSGVLPSGAVTVERWGPAYHLGLDHVAGRVKVAGRYERSFVPSIGFGGLNGNQRLSASATVPFAQGRFIASGNVSYGRVEPVDFIGVDFTSNSVWTQGTFGYQMTRWLRTEAFINRVHQTTTARGQVDRTRIGIEFVTAKPVRIQ